MITRLSVLLMLATGAAAGAAAFHFGHVQQQDSRPIAQVVGFDEALQPLAPEEAPIPRGLPPDKRAHYGGPAAPKLSPAERAAAAWRGFGSQATATTSAVEFAVTNEPAPVAGTTPGVTFESSSDASPAPVPVGPPLQISDVHVTALTPLSATLAWRTSDIAIGAVSYGRNAPTIWTPATPSGQDHQAVLSGLSPGGAYKLEVLSRTENGRLASSPFLLTTPPLENAMHATASGGTILLDGQPFFPTIVWAQCADGFEGNLAVGINTFLGSACDGSELERLSGRAFTATARHESGVGGVGRIGWYLPDEWDTHLPNDLSVQDVQKMAPPAVDGGISFLTLTNHFYSGAAPLPQGRGMYPALIASADVLGFDLYPLQNWCRASSFADVYDSQKELVQLAAGKPTFQWIEARRMDCAGGILDPTPETVRAETWLSIAAGAHGVGYFPNNWSPEVGVEIARVNQEIADLAPALLESVIGATVAPEGPLRVGVRSHGGALYVIAVNSSRDSTSATITVPGLGDRTLTTLDGSRTVTAASNAFADTFGPLEVHLYIAAPAA